VVFEVEDRGPGVPSREGRAIFRPFRRGLGADVTAGGVGLGLALARRWAQLLGGRLSLRKGPQHPGACFRLELPLDRTLLGAPCTSV
jgi:signal transduction histidine kinase